MRHSEPSDGQAHYLDSGSGETVLLLHGLGSCGADWAPQANALCARFRVIAPDLRGHGRSPAPPGPWRIADFAGDMLALLDQLGASRVHLVGFSLGGMVALEMADRAPQRFASLCLINSQPFDAARPPALLFAYWLRRAVIAVCGMRAVARMIGNKLFPRAEQRALLERFVAQMAGMPKTAYLTALDAIFHWRIAPRFDALSMPVLIMAADQDYTALALKRAFAARFSNCRFEIIADSRHASPLDQVKLVNTLLSSFLATTSNNTPSNVETP